MSRLRVAPIVEGFGEVASLRILLSRLWAELGGDYVEVLRPFRQPRMKLAKPELLRQAVASAAVKLASSGSADPGVVLVLVDRDPASEPPCVLAPQWLDWLREIRERVDVIVLFAEIEYETWFVAAAESLTEFLDIDDTPIPDDPEAERAGKGWIQECYSRPGRSYSEPVDQPSMTASMDLSLCRRRSPSFDKLCRELEQRLRR